MLINRRENKFDCIYSAFLLEIQQLTDLEEKRELQIHRSIRKYHIYFEMYNYSMKFIVVKSSNMRRLLESQLFCLFELPFHLDLHLLLQMKYSSLTHSSYLTKFSCHGLQSVLVLNLNEIRIGFILQNSKSMEYTRCSSSSVCGC